MIKKKEPYDLQGHLIKVQTHFTSYDLMDVFILQQGQT
jgi:hypothetical protein